MTPDDYHALYDGGIQAARSAELPTREAPSIGRDQLSADVPDLVIEEDETTGLPNRIVSRQPSGRLSAPGPSDPGDAVRQFIQDRRAVWNLTEEDATAVEVRSVSRVGLKAAQLYQRVDGVEIFDSDVTVAFDDENGVISTSGQFFPGAGVAARGSRATHARTPEDSVARAAFDLTRVVYQSTDFVPAETQPDSGPYRSYEFRAGEKDRRPRFERPIRVKEVMFPLGNQQFASGHYLELWILGFPAFSYVIDSVETPFVLFRKNLSSEGVPFTYRVQNTGDRLFRPHDGPAPGSPHPTGVPDGFQSPTVAERLVTLESLPGRDP
jgi:extracellular elastinolytic metalloproteinase